MVQEMMMEFKCKKSFRFLILWSRNLLGIILLILISHINITSIISQTPQIETNSTKLNFNQKLELLFVKLKSCQCVFVRNGSEHTPEEAISHMKLKLGNSGGRIQTVPNFIKYIATKSSFSGSVYKIRWKNGDEKEAGPWLSDRAKEMNIYH